LSKIERLITIGIMNSEEQEFLHQRILEHWEPRADLTAVESRISAELRRSGKVNPDALASFDQLHVGQMAATRRFSAWVNPAPGTRVLDLGAGLGGAARHLASVHGCLVTALDLSPLLSAAGARLTRWCGLQASVTHRTGDLIDTSRSEQFDLIWLQHIDMQVPDKTGLYLACGSAVAPGGRVVWHDWLEGSGGKPRYPVVWSTGGEASYPVRASQLRQELHRCGFSAPTLHPITADTAEWLQTTIAQLESRLLKSSGGKERITRLLESHQVLLTNIENKRLIPFFGSVQVRP
jgi:sarcosine/dimethylglycine N-methyltransferase